MNSLFAQAVESYPWASEEQKEGYLAWVQYERGFGREPELPIRNDVAFLIQKSHEAAEYWRDTFSGQTTALQTEVANVQGQIQDLQKDISYLQDLIKSQQNTIDLLVKNQG